MPGAQRRTFPKELKIDVINRWLSGKQSLQDLARELGVQTSLISIRWYPELKKEGVKFVASKPPLYVPKTMNSPISETPFIAAATSRDSEVLAKVMTDLINETLRLKSIIDQKDGIIQGLEARLKTRRV